MTTKATTKLRPRSKKGAHTLTRPQKSAKKQPGNGAADSAPVTARPPSTVRIPRRQPLPGMERQPIPQLDRLADLYADALDARMSYQKQETAARDEIIGVMRNRQLHTYQLADGRIITLEHSEADKISI